MDKPIMAITVGGASQLTNLRPHSIRAAVKDGRVKVFGHMQCFDRDLKQLLSVTDVESEWAPKEGETDWEWAKRASKANLEKITVKNVEGVEMVIFGAYISLTADGFKERNALVADGKSSEADDDSQ